MRSESVYDYEIKPHIIQLVKQNIFNGMALENLMDHVEQFEELCNTTKTNGVPQDYLMLTLFKILLGDRASRWLKLLEPGSITTWDQCRDLFINHFDPKSKLIA
ncbi:hypothetical protein V5N11_036078 [Cardamine amara subsp. amara]|uniref:Retrotransposon gag domain-containing protein n=1 Tax=Cardamine amara subsp. amara TaxID=228776 RepID=A0ABD0ZVY7_CARAN